jgi:hypothetical protein
LRLSLGEYHRPSRDVPAPGPNWLEAALQPLASARLLKT